MNVHSQSPRTAAETALIDSYSQRMAELPGDTSVVSARDNAVELLKAGLPTRRVEHWHYTDLRRFLTEVPAYDPSAYAQKAQPLLEGSAVFALLNGVADKAPSVEGVTAASTAQALSDASFPYELAPAGSDDTIGAINTALVADGFLVEIADGAEIEAPLELQNIHAGGQAHARFAVKAGAGSRATIVERQTGEGAALVSSIAHLEVGDGADIRWLIVQDQPADTTHLGQINIAIGSDAKLTLFIMNAGGKLVRQEVRAVARGENSDFRLRGINLLGGEAHCDVTMVLDHVAPHTVSTETFRNIVTDSASGVFQGQIRVARDAQKTDAKMACNTLLLSDDADFSAKPELEIFADDVACGHGATVTEIARQHLFYLMARGIDEKAARGLLVKAFVAEIIEELEDDRVVEVLEQRLDAWFADHG